MTTSSGPKHIAFLSIDGLTDPLGQSQILPYLGGLTGMGYRVCVISAEKPERFDKYRDQIQKICDQQKIEWHPVPYRISPPLVSSLFNIRSLYREARKVHLNNKLDLVHCRSYLPAFAGLRLKKRFGIKMLFDIRGFWADERVDGELWDLKNPIWRMIYAFFKRKEKAFFLQADHTISLTRAARDEIHSWDLPSNPIPIDVIPCCADLGHFDYHRIEEKDVIKLRRELQITKEHFVVTYLGSLGTSYALEEMLDLFKFIRESYPNALFFVITASPSELVWNMLPLKGIPADCVRVASARREEVPVYLSLGKISLVFYKQNYSRKACSPTKLGELMGLGIPCICSPNVGDTGEIIREAGAGYELTGFSDEEYRLAVEQIPILLSTPREQIRQAAFRYFSLQDGIMKYAAVYSTLLG